MNFVLDSSAVLAILRAERGREFMETLLGNTAHHFSMHTVNLVEVFYRIERERGERAPIFAAIAVRSFGVRVRERLDLDFARDVARVKSRIQHISLGDCVCVALARQLNATVLTTDHAEFTAVRDTKLCRVRFIR